MMRRPPPRPGVGKKSSSSGFKVTYSVNQLLTMGKELLSEEPVCPPPEGWEKYQFDKIGPLHQDDANSRPAHASTKDYLATLVLRPGSARDLHAGHLDVLANKQAQEPDRSPVLGSRGGGGGGSRGAGLGWGDRDRDRDRYDRNKERDRGLSRFGHDRDCREDGGRRDRARDVQQPSNRPPSRWDALKPDRDRDRGYNNRNNRDSRDRDDGDGLGAGGLSRQDARLGGGRDRDRDGRNTRSGGDSLRDGGLAAHDRALASERAIGAAGSKEKERERSVGSGAGAGRDRFGGGGGISNEADIWDMPTSALPGGDDKKGTSKDPPRNSRAAGLRSAEREQREKDRREEEAREFQATKLMFEKERAAFKKQGQQKGTASGDGAAVSNGDATGFPDMGGGFLDSSDSGNQDGNNITGKDNLDSLGNGALEKSSPSTPAGDKVGEDLSAKRGDDKSNDRKTKEETRPGSFLGNLLGGGGRAGGSSGEGGNGMQGGGTATAEGGGEGKGGRGGGETGGAFPGQGLFLFMPPGSSISTIDKFTEVTRGGASKIFSPDGMIDGTGITGLSPWEKKENKTAKAVASPPTTITGGGGTSGESSNTASLSAAEKSVILKRMIMGGGGGATRGPGATIPAPAPSPTPLPQPGSHGRAAGDSGGNDREGGSTLWKNRGVPMKALQAQAVGDEGGAGAAGDGPLRAASTAEVDMLMKKLAVARLPEDQRREAFEKTQWQPQQLHKEQELRQHYKQPQPVVGDQLSPLLRTSQPPLAPFGSPSHSVMVGQPEPLGGPSLQSGMTSLSPSLLGIAYRPGLQMPLTGGGGTGGAGGTGGLMPPPSKVPTNDGQHPQLGADMATVEEFRRKQVQQQQQQQQQRRHQQELYLQQQQRHREMERHVDQYRQLQMHQKKLEQRRLEQERIEQQRLEQRLEMQRLEQQRLEQRRLEQQRQQDLRHRQEQQQQQLEQQQAALRQRQQQQQQQQRRYAAEVTGVPPGSGAPMIHQQQQLLRQRQLQMQHQQQQQMHLRQQHPHSQHLSRGAATVSGGRGMQGMPLGATLLQQQQRRQLVGENSSEGAPHMLSPMGGPMMMTGVHPASRQSQQQGGGEYSSLAAGGHLQQRVAPQQQPPPTHSPPSMARGASGVSDSSIANMFNNAEFPSRTRADVDLLSVLGLQKTPADQGAGHSSYGGGGDLSSTGGGGGHHFAFHEPQPGARRARATNGMSGSMALDPRARARMGAVPGIGVGGRKVGVRPGAPAGQITADEMERMVNGN